MAGERSESSMSCMGSIRHYPAGENELYDTLKCNENALCIMSETHLRLSIEAVKSIVHAREEYKGRGRKPHDPVFLTALTYLMLRSGMSLREMERWCMENMALLKSMGYGKSYPPTRTAFKKILDSLTARDIQRITAKIKYLRGEIKTLWF